MRLRAIVLGSSLLAAACAVACSASQPATSEDDETSAPDRDSGAPQTNDTPASSTDPTTPDFDAGDTDGGTSDAAGDGGSVLVPGDGGKSCGAGSLAEIEPNNTEATANVLPNVSGSVCGRLTTSADIDFATFTMPADKNYLFTGYAVSSNGVTLTITVDGESFKAGAAPIVHPGSKYVIKATSTNSKEVDWRVDYGFEQK